MNAPRSSPCAIAFHPSRRPTTSTRGDRSKGWEQSGGRRLKQQRPARTLTDVIAVHVEPDDEHVMPPSDPLRVRYQTQHDDERISRVSKTYVELQPPLPRKHTLFAAQRVPSTYPAEAVQLLSEPPDEHLHACARANVSSERELRHIKQRFRPDGAATERAIETEAAHAAGVQRSVIGMSDDAATVCAPQPAAGDAIVALLVAPDWDTGAIVARSVVAGRANRL